MRKFIKGLLVGLCCLCMNIQAQVYGGKCGDNATWYYSEQTRILNIQGKGSTWHMGWHIEGQPWESLRDKVKYICVGEGIVFLDHNTFAIMRATEEVSLPETMTGFGFGVFQTCRSLKSITLPENVGYMSGATFAQKNGISAIREIVNLSKEPQPERYESGLSTFAELDFENINLYVPGESIEKYKAAAGWKNMKIDSIKEHRIRVSKVLLGGIDTSYIEKGFEKQFSYVIEPENATDKRALFSSSDPEIASIDAESGIMTIKKAGEVQIAVTSLDGGYTDKIDFIIPKSKNANLKSLSADGIELSPKFDKNETEYYATVNSDIDIVNIAAKAEDSLAIVHCLPKSLRDGDNTAIIGVTAEDITVTKEYRLHIYRKSKEARLKSMVINQGSLEPGFKPDTKEYIWRITKKEPYLEISTVPMHDKAIAEEIKNSFKGDTSFLILTTAEDNRYGEKYTVKVEAYEDNASLKDLKVEGFELKPEFQPHISKYDVTVSNETREVKVIAVPEDSKATISGQTGWIQITGAEMLFTINVLAEDRISHHAYQIKVRKEALATDIEKVEDFYDERVSIYTVDGRYLGTAERYNKKIIIPDWLGHGIFIAKGSKYREKFTN